MDVFILIGSFTIVCLMGMPVAYGARDCLHSSRATGRTVHFGIIMILNLGIGLLTPPVGPTMVVGCAIGRVSMEAVSRSILIFYVPMVIVLLLLTHIPALTLWLSSVVLE